jgi:DNA-binding Lrp family transcriptional regulator
VAFISEQNSLNNLHFKEMTKLIDNINIRIISELVKSPDTSSLALANKLHIPLSSLQRRRARLEKFLLNKAYHVNLKALGGKMGDVIINVEKGKSREVALDVLKKYKNNIMNVSTRINTEHNISAQLLYKDTAELHSLLESIKSIPYVTALQWSEIVEIIGDNSSSVISAFFDQQEKLIVQDTSSSKR